MGIAVSEAGTYIDRGVPIILQRADTVPRKGLFVVRAADIRAHRHQAVVTHSEPEVCPVRRVDEVPIPILQTVDAPEHAVVADVVVRHDWHRVACGVDISAGYSGA